MIATMIVAISNPCVAMTMLCIHCVTCSGKWAEPFLHNNEDRIDYSAVEDPPSKNVVSTFQSNRPNVVLVTVCEACQIVTDVYAEKSKQCPMLTMTACRPSSMAVSINYSWLIGS